MYFKKNIYIIYFVIGILLLSFIIILVFSFSHLNTLVQTLISVSWLDITVVVKNEVETKSKGPCSSQDQTSTSQIHPHLLPDKFVIFNQ